MATVGNQWPLANSKTVIPRVLPLEGRTRGSFHVKMVILQFFLLGYRGCAGVLADPQSHTISNTGHSSYARVLFARCGVRHGSTMMPQRGNTSC
jgi:hypothetical protein